MENILKILKRLGYIERKFQKMVKGKDKACEYVVYAIVWQERYFQEGNGRKLKGCSNDWVVDSSTIHAV